MNKIKGDLIKFAINGKFDVIIHGCNCFCTMGAGIAKTIKEKCISQEAASHTTGIII